jgi:hypothetical protein
MNENFATKSDLKLEIDRLENKMQSGFSEIKSEMRELEYKLTIKLGVMLTVAVGATATVVRREGSVPSPPGLNPPA